MGNETVREHVSSTEKEQWRRCYNTFFNTHLGKGGTDNHPLANGTVAGFSINNFSWNDKNKLGSCEWGALNNPHPATHPYTMITGLHSVAHSGRYPELLEKPIFPEAANGCDAATVTGIRITIGTNYPSNPIHRKEIYINPSTRIWYVYENGSWIPMGASYV